MAMALKINDEAIETIEFTASMRVALLLLLPESDEEDPNPINWFSPKKIIN
jgi:hypothetical protein